MASATSDFVPAIYDGREQAWIKHQLLESYLEKLLMTIGMSARKYGKVEICYVDCFAGPWGDDSEKMEGTSIAISLRTMASCQQEMARLGVKVTMRALYVEWDKQAFKRLSAYLKLATPSGIESDCREGDFLSLRQDILQWCGSTAFAFFFIDPKGWKPVGVHNLQPLLARPQSEFLINFMYDFINRTASMREWQIEISEILDIEAEKVEKLVGAPPKLREQVLLNTYRKGLKGALPPIQRNRFKPRTAYVRVMDRLKERAKYHLVYLTTHPVGIIEFMNISHNVELIQKRVRIATKVDLRQEKSGMADMFQDSFAILPEEFQASSEDVDRFWLSSLSTTPRQIDEDAFADILEEHGFTPKDLQESLVRLIKAGKVRNIDAKGPRPRIPLHYKNKDRLELT